MEVNPIHFVPYITVFFEKNKQTSMTFDNFYSMERSSQLGTLVG